MKPAVKCLIFAILSAANFPVYGYYVALIPKTIREDSSSIMVVSNIGVDSEERLKVTVSNTRNDLVYDFDVSVPINVTTTVSKKLLVNGKHVLRVHDKRSDVKSRFELLVDRSSLSVYIQTDKPIYKPGDTIRFRVLVLDHELKPSVVLKSINVKLTDSNANLIREWPYGNLVNGVFQSELELANFVPLGNWTLTATVLNGKTKQKQINVDEYVLPKHEIRISSPKSAVYTDSTLKLIVDAVYTFGKPIQGELTVSEEDSGTVYETNINGRTIATLDMSSLVEGKFFIEFFYVTISATIKETGSGNLYQHSEQIPIYRKSHLITLRKSSFYLTPGVNFKCWFKVTDPSGAPFNNPEKLVVRATLKEATVTQKIPDRHGIVALSFDVTSDNTKSLQLDVTYAGEKTFFSVEPLHEDDTFIKASVLTDDPELDQPVRVLVTSSFNLSPYLYFVIARGEIISRARIYAKARQKSTFSFPATIGMVPSASVVVFALHNGQLLQDIVHFEVKGLKNFVNVTLSEQETEPRRKVTLKVDSLPGSMVGLLAVDKSVLLLGTGNDITRQSLHEESVVPNTDKIEDLGFTVLTNANQIDLGDVDTRFSDADDGPIRKYFPETWLWTEMSSVSSTGSLSLTATVPDTITSWSISAFAVSASQGLGLIEQPVSLTVLKPFFITVNTAYSIVKTEIALVEVYVYNYMHRAQDAKIKLVLNPEEFQLVDDNGLTIDAVDLTKTVLVFVESVEKVQFYIKPKRSGDLSITVTAETTSNKFDGVQRSVKVTSGGIRYYRNEPRFIEVDDSRQHFDISLLIPSRATAGSENITFSVEGLLLGAALTNMDRLIRIPTGCGEQKMSKLVPTVIALEYMVSSDTLRRSFKPEALRILSKGYQDLLNYKRSDGSFYVFTFDRQGSVLLTALVAKILRIAGKHIIVDENVVRNAYEFIKNSQSSDGSFSEVGSISDRLQGGLKGGVTLTAYTLIAILEHKNLARKYKSVVDKGTEFIAGKLDTISKPYDLAIVSYALQLSNHPRKQSALDELLDKSVSDSHMRWWDDGRVSIETTAYALLTFLNSGRYIDAGPVMKWLVTQRYDTGSYGNTQNTFLGLQALAEYSSKLAPSGNSYEIAISYGSGRRQILRVNGMTSPISQKLSLPSDVRNVGVSITGTGTGVFQIAYQYNAVTIDDEPRFELTKSVQRGRSDSFFTVRICARFKPKNDNEVTNMVLLEVLLPSGYVIADQTTDKLKRVKEVMKVEKKRDDTRLVMYFNSLSKENSTCVDIHGMRKAIVLGQIAGLIKVYDYYDPAREAIEYFDVRRVTSEAGF